MAAGAALFGALIALALWCRARPPVGLGVAVERLLGFFGVEGLEQSVLLGDFFGVAGSSGLIFLLVAERGGWAIDPLLIADIALSALGAGLAITWLIARIGGGPAPRELFVRDVPRALYTEVDPRIEESSSRDPLP